MPDPGPVEPDRTAAAADPAAAGAADRTDEADEAAEPSPRDLQIAQIWIMVRILVATLLILVGFAVLVGLLIQLT